MQVQYQYASPSRCMQNGGQTTLGLSPDLSREEQVSFLGKLKHPLQFRDAMLMLRQIVISDMSQKKKDRTDYFQWLEGEIERRIQQHEQFLPGVRENLEKDIQKTMEELNEHDKRIEQLHQLQKELQQQVKSYDSWKDYYKIERDFWKFIKDRDYALWFVLDPVITVHQDQVSFEAFSIDESTYGCLSIDMDEFEMLQPPKLGTTNIDFSAKLEREMERFRTYSDVTLSVNPGGFQVDSGVMPEYLEKKIDLPETWIKGFNQVSAAASLGGIQLQLSPSDMYDICSFLRRHKEKKSPRYMKWILKPNQPVQVLFEPFGTILTLNTIYTGDKQREEKIWGRRRWLVIEKLIPLAKSFQVCLLGFGLPQFICADMGTMKMTIGFSSWSANDWVKGTAFNIMGGFIGDGNYEKVYQLLKQKRCLSMDNIIEELAEKKNKKTKAGIGMLLRRGEGYFDFANQMIRFRQLCNTPIPPELYQTTELEVKVQNLTNAGLDHLTIEWNEKNQFVFHNTYSNNHPEIVIDEDGQLVKVNCNCRTFQKGVRNISEPCEHVLALYIASTVFLRLKNLEHNKKYRINDIMEMLL